MSLHKIARRFLVLTAVVLATGGAAGPETVLVTGADRVTLCEVALEEVDPRLYLPGELSSFFEDGCPRGTVLCPARCCVQSGCCNPTLQACCDATCTYTCIQGKACVSC